MRNAVVSCYPDMIKYAKSQLNRYLITNINAEDIVQEVIVQILAANPQVEGGEVGEKLYLIGSTEWRINTYIRDHIRHTRLMGEWSDKKIVCKSHEHPYDPEIVERAWACLNAGDRELLTARTDRKGTVLAKKYGVTRQRIDQKMNGATKRFKGAYRHIETEIQRRENVSQALSG